VFQKLKFGAQRRQNDIVSDVRFGVAAENLKARALAVGFEVDARDQAVAEQERHDVVTVRALVLGRVEREPVMEIEQAVGPRTHPNQRVERRQQRTRFNAARYIDVAMQVGLLFPTFDAYWTKRSSIDKLSKARLGRCDRQAEIIAQI